MESGLVVLRALLAFLHGCVEAARADARVVSSASKSAPGRRLGLAAISYGTKISASESSEPLPTYLHTYIHVMYVCLSVCLSVCMYVCMYLLICSFLLHVVRLDS